MEYYEKIENYELRKIKLFLKAYIAMEKTIIKLGDIGIENQKFHPHKTPVSRKNSTI